MGNGKRSYIKGNCGEGQSKFGGGAAAPFRGEKGAGKGPAMTLQKKRKRGVRKQKSVGGTNPKRFTVEHQNKQPFRRMDGPTL